MLANWVEYTILTSQQNYKNLNIDARPRSKSYNTWKIYMDGSSNSERSEMRVVIVSPEGVITEHALSFEFPVMNNDAEYEPWSRD